MRISDWSSDVCSSDLPGARAAAGRAFLASPLHDLAGDQQEEILDEVLRVFEAPELALLFGPGSRAEVPLAGLVESVAGPQVIAGPVARLLLEESTVWLIDYKTQPPADRRWVVWGRSVS